MMLSSNGLNLIKSFEGFVDHAYLDSGGLCTIGYGHTGGVKLGDTCTEAQAEQLLANDTDDAVALVNTCRVQLTQNQFDSLVSLAFNIGGTAFLHSALWRLVNAGDFAGAAAQFTLWDSIDGTPIAGLERRREAEQKLFTEGLQ